MVYLPYICAWPQLQAIRRPLNFWEAFPLLAQIVMHIQHLPLGGGLHENAISILVGDVWFCLFGRSKLIDRYTPQQAKAAVLTCM